MVGWLGLWGGFWDCALRMNRVWSWGRYDSILHFGVEGGSGIHSFKVECLGLLLGPPVLPLCRLFWRSLCQRLVGSRVPLLSRGYWEYKACSGRVWGFKGLRFSGFRRPRLRGFIGLGLLVLMAFLFIGFRANAGGAAAFFL